MGEKKMPGISSYEQVEIDRLIPYINNARTHSEGQITRIAASIREFGFLAPCVIDRAYNVIAGHGRILAARKLGMETVPCVFVEGLTEAQRKAYVLADNRLGEFSDWDMDLVTSELEALQAMDFEADLTGFDADGTGGFFTENRKPADRQDGNEDYNEFLDKFEQKHTTDDCYTPENVYDCVAGYVEKTYGLNRNNFVRPFYPGGDYQNFKYRPESVVVDNPPFSIMAEIVAWYCERGQRFFLFAPSLTILHLTKNKAAAICVNADITYENGALVHTSFVTNLEPEETAARTDPNLYEALTETNRINEAALHKSLPKYEFPDNVATAAMLSYMSTHGTEYAIRRKEAVFIRSLDAMDEADKGIFGGALLLSEKAAAEKWTLSERELQIITELGENA